ncbi:MAG: GNAT family N-acetyltransferase [Vicingaceae bacterium]
MKSEILQLLNDYQVDLNLKDTNTYFEKLQKLARIITFYDQRLKGFIAYYCNDEKKDLAFISMIIVDRNSIGQKIGRTLLNSALSNMSYSGFLKCRLEVLAHNINAIGFYEKQGFQKIEIEGEVLVMEKLLN